MGEIFCGLGTYLALGVVIGLAAFIPFYSPTLRARAERNRQRALDVNRRPKPRAIAWLIP